MSSEDDETQLMAAFKVGGRKPNAIPSRTTVQPSISPEAFISDEDSPAESSVRRDASPKTRRAVCVRASPVRNKSQYTYYEPEEKPARIIRSLTRRGKTLYEVELGNYTVREVSEIVAEQTPNRASVCCRITGESGGARVRDFAVIITRRCRS